MAVVFEVKHDCVLAGRKWRRALPAEAFGGDLDVGENRFALDQVKAEATKAATQRNKHPLGPSLRNFHLGRDGIGLVENVGSVAVGESGRFTGVSEDGLSSRGTRSRRGRSSTEAVIQREHALIFFFHA